MDLDRISSLPDPIICHILSYLPTKDAARTSGVSTRWKCLFLSVPKIILDERLSPMGKEGRILQMRRGKNENLDFIEFVNRRLVLSKTSINEFQLKCIFFPEAFVFEFWLTTLVSLNPEVLDIKYLECFGTTDPLLYPPSKIFSCETLVIFKLCGIRFLFKIPESVHFPKLKVLHLESLAVEFPSESCMFAQGYPVIEDLRLERVEVPSNQYRHESLGIYLKTLLKLAILFLDDIWEIDIHTPRLQHLVTNSGRPGKCYNMDMNFLRCESIVSAELHQVHVPLLNQVNNVKKLCILTVVLEVKPQYLDSVPLFPNLTNLELRAIGKTMWFILERAPILAALVYRMDCRPRGPSLLPENVPVCVAKSLRRINIIRFKGGEEECAAVRYFLNHAAALEKMTIELEDGGIQELPSCILKESRRSPNCEIKVLKSCPFLLGQALPCSRVLYLK